MLTPSPQRPEARGAGQVSGGDGCGSAVLTSVGVDCSRGARLTRATTARTPPVAHGPGSARFPHRMLDAPTPPVAAPTPDPAASPRRGSRP